MKLNSRILNFEAQPTQVQEFWKVLESRKPGMDEKISQATQSILHQVQKNGLKAVLEFRQQFESIPSTHPLIWNSHELKPPLDEVSESIQRTLNLAKNRITVYHSIQKETSKTWSDSDSTFTSHVVPLQRVGVYVPGGKAFYPSSVLMSVIPAQVAGVKEITVFTPARSLQNPVFLYTIQLLNVTRVVATGGAQAVAAAAFGLGEHLPKQDKMVGPGNIYVATAKHLCSGIMGTDGFAGPSEILILGDGSSNPKWIAADLLAQAEHDPQASSVLVTTSAKEAQEVSQCLEELLPQCLDRANMAKEAWENFGAIIVVPHFSQLVDIANEICPEHLQVHTQCAQTPEGYEYWTSQLRTAGAIFLGKFTAEAFGDYLAGPSHVLPTAGTARFASALGVYDFTRRCSVLSMSHRLAQELAQPTSDFAQAEELWAHGLSARMRQ